MLAGNNLAARRCVGRSRPWADRSPVGLEAGSAGLAEYGSTQQASSHLKQQMGAGDQPGKRREGHRAAGTSEWDRVQGQRSPGNSACELAGVTW